MATACTILSRIPAEDTVLVIIQHILQATAVLPAHIHLVRNPTVAVIPRVLPVLLHQAAIAVHLAEQVLVPTLVAEALAVVASHAVVVPLAEVLPAVAAPSVAAPVEAVADVDEFVWRNRKKME